MQTHTSFLAVGPPLGVVRGSIRAREQPPPPAHGLSEVTFG